VIQKLKVQTDLDTLKGKERAPGNQRWMTELLVNLGNLCHATGDFEEGLQSFKKAIRIAKETDYPLKEAEAHLGIGHILEKQNKWNEGIENLQKGLALSRSIDYPLGIADASRWLAHLHWHKSEYEEALKWLDTSMDNAERTGDDKIIGMTMVEYGLIYSDKGELDRARKYLSDSIPLFERAREYKQLARVYNNLGDAAMQAGEWKKAITLFDKCGEASAMINNQEMMAWGLFNSAEALINSGDIDEAIKRGQNALAILEPLGDILGIQGSTRILALAYTEKKEWEEAEEHFEKADSMVKDSPYHTGMVHYNWGEMYKAKGDKKNAKEHFTIAKEQLEKIGAMMLLEKTDNALESL